ncbi:Protein of uncharacterised function (DUF3796) [[Clostridium] sordellii]|uniref:DUF3796 domain-containing protein n=1 Tax=Paraclostridium sordellii TaxID=1505 RepID=UPI0005DA74BF|nr:DUF3796 domain-containing protein [Paeniclostridium sordellii]CEN88775.1 Protein of uncharacterised function (DUF3796) [[Clostridium] sordellii] [Paeniclostridium sordellii]
MKKINSSKYLFLLALLGFSGFPGFAGINGEPSDLLWFSSWGSFSYIWWAKLDNFEDERLKFNKYRAGSIAFRICLLIAFTLSILSFLQPNLTFELLCRTQLLILTLTFAVSVNLWAFLTYRFDMKS